MKKQILLLSLIILTLGSCDKVKDPGVDIPVPIDEAIISTLWNTVSAKYQYRDDADKVVRVIDNKYPDPNKQTIQYKFQDNKKVIKTDKVKNTQSIEGSWEIVRENKKDYVIITWNKGPVEKYEVTSYTNTLMYWHIVDTEGENLKYTKDGQTYIAAKRIGDIELHCPCRDPQ